MGKIKWGEKELVKAGKPRLVDNSYFDTPYQDSFRLTTSNIFGSAVKTKSLCPRNLCFLN